MDTNIKFSHKISDFMEDQSGIKVGIYGSLLFGDFHVKFS